MLDDVKVALRALRSSKTFTAAALAVLTVGIGASTVIFSVVDAVVFRALPFPEPDRILAVGQRTAVAPGTPQNPNRDPEAVSRLSPQNYLDVAARQRVFDGLAAVAGGTLTLRAPGVEPEELTAQFVTADFFRVLGEAPRVGSALTSQHEVDGRHRVAVVSDAFWRRRLGASPQAVGSRLPLDDGAYEVIGVMPPHFMYPIGASAQTDLWVPFVVPPDQRVRVPRTVSAYLQAVARLKADVSRRDAQAQMDQIAAALQQEHPQWNAGTMIGVRPLRDHLVSGRTQSWMVMLLGAVGLLLLIACANVATLLLGRITSRHREIRIRAALGASRWRIVRGIVVESLVLALLGGASAMLMALWGIGLLDGAMPASVARIGEIALDMRVASLAGGLAVLTGTLCSVVPAVQVSRPDLANALKEDSRGAGPGAGRQRGASLLVVLELALAVVLLVGTALFVGSFRTLVQIDPGFEPEKVLAVAVFPAADGAGPPRDQTPAFEAILDRVRQAPGVVDAAAVTGGLPLGGGQVMTSIAVPGQAREPEAISVRVVTPSYHAVLGIRRVHGRFFEPGDAAGAPLVAIISQSAAARYFGTDSPVGRIARVNGVDRTLVGVVGDIHQSSLETDPAPQAYLPAAQSPIASADIVVRTSDEPYAALPAVRGAVFAAFPDVPLRNVRTLGELVAGRVAQRRMIMLLLGVLGVLGLLLSVVGTYGVMINFVSQRTREIAVRMALGAERSRVVSMVLARVGVLIALGLAIGSSAAWFLSATVRTFLFRMDPTDPRAYIAAIGTLGAAALIASVIPAVRAATVDPLVALREG